MMYKRLEDQEVRALRAVVITQNEIIRTDRKKYDEYEKFMRQLRWIIIEKITGGVMGKMEGRPQNEHGFGTFDLDMPQGINYMEILYNIPDIGTCVRFEIAGVNKECMMFRHATSNFWMCVFPQGNVFINKHDYHRLMTILKKYTRVRRYVRDSRVFCEHRQ